MQFKKTEFKCINKLQQTQVISPSLSMISGVLLLNSTLHVALCTGKSLL